MRKSITTAFAFSLLGVSFALAQGTGGSPGTGANPSVPPALTPDSRVIGNAPVGHRQPRASDVPSASEKNYTESAQDKELDRKIKSICRGC